MKFNSRWKGAILFVVAACVGTTYLFTMPLTSKPLLLASPTLRLLSSGHNSNELTELGDTIQRRLTYLQNPTNCKAARKLVCDTNPSYGYGSIMHHVTMCLMLAYATERTFVLNSKDWVYAPGGWETFFQPLSTTCLTTYGEQETPWGRMENITNATTVKFPRYFEASPPPDQYMSAAIPKDLASRLKKLCKDPFVWWVGQFVKYVTRPQRHLAVKLDNAERELGFMNSIVGVHVRRTDKLVREAEFHSLDEYMEVVEEFYTRLEEQGQVDQRKVYLATDEPKVITEARENYPEYVFVNNYNATADAHGDKRFSPDSLEGIIRDIHFLSKSDYLVCTLSSNICRAAYEMMNTYHEDAASRIFSLDDMYYLVLDMDTVLTVVQEHRPQQADEIELRVGDKILHSSYPNHGFSIGVNERTNQTGYFPFHKVVQDVSILNMPTYPKADKNIVIKGTCQND